MRLMFFHLFEVGVIVNTAEWFNFSIHFTKTSSMAVKKKGSAIPIDRARKMIDHFKDHIQGLALPKNKSTEYVSFDLPEFQKWLTSVTPYSDELKIFLGVYPDDHPEAGRLTLVIWPYKADQPAAEPRTVGKGGTGGGFGPYNDGNSGP